MAPVDDHFFAGFRVYYKRRTVVAAPGVVGGFYDKFYFGKIDARFYELADDELLQCFVVGNDPDMFSLADRLDKRQVLGPHFGELIALP
ncbi:hypothetical protein D3C86_1849690 [compost metagenome]